MKKINISKEKIMSVSDPVKYFNESIKESSKVWIIKTDDISDWYHTFWELYKHRIHLFIALCKKLHEINIEFLSEYATPNDDKPPYELMKTKIHKDWLNVWNEWGMFLLLIVTDKWQLSYHLPNEYWDKCDFVETIDERDLSDLPDFDWHTSDDVLERLLLI